MKIRIAIVDDNSIIREKVANIVRNVFVGSQILMREYTRAEALLFDEEQDFDIYLLDIEMSGMNGIELSNAIRERGNKGEIIFLTSYEQYALQGYQSHAYAYLLKSDMDAKLSGVLEKLRDKLRETRSSYYVIETANRFEKIKIEDIRYIYKEEKNCIFVTADGDYRERITISEVHARLSGEGFVLVDKGMLVNILHVERIAGDSVYLGQGVQFRISRTHTKKMKDAVRQFWSGRI